MKKSKGKSIRPDARAWWGKNRLSCIILAAAVVVFIIVRALAATHEQPQPRGEDYAEYEAAVAAESVPCLHPDGTAAQLPQGSLLVLAQCYDRGNANITLTDAKGLSVGALRVVVPAA